VKVAEYHQAGGADQTWAIRGVNGALCYDGLPVACCMARRWSGGMPDLSMASTFAMNSAVVPCGRPMAAKAAAMRSIESAKAAVLLVLVAAQPEHHPGGAQQIVGGLG